MRPNFSRGIICLAFLVSVSVAVCPDGLSWCQDPLKGILCYNSTYTSCVLDSNQRSYTLCGTGLQSCGGICFHPNLNSCNNSVLVAPLDFTIVIPTSEQTPTQAVAPSSTITMSSETQQNDTQTPSTSSISTSSTSRPTSYPAPIPGAGGAPPRYQPPATSSTSPSTSSTSSTSTSSTTSTTSPTTSTTSRTISTSPKTSTSSTKATAFPAPVPGPGQAPPRYVPPTITESF